MDIFSGNGLACLRGGRMVFVGLDFTVRAGEVLCLVGPNGSGKSTLLRLMAGLLRPALGEMRWNGQPVGDDGDGHRGRLAYLGHHDPVKPVLTVAENLAFWADMRGGPREAVAAALERIGIAQLADVPGRFLSAGQKRRLNLARILLSGSPLWLLDEPLTALDQASAAAFREATRDHCSGGGMAVVATHVEFGLAPAARLALDAFTPGPEPLP